MNDNHNDTIGAWNDPPLFSLDQMSKTSGVQHRRNRYPQPINSNPSTNQQMFTTNAFVDTNKPLVGQQLHQTNQLNQRNEQFFDINSFIVTINSTVGLISNLPQDLVYKWHNIANSLRNTYFETQTKSNFESILRGIQTNDFNSVRLSCGHLNNDSNETVRTSAQILYEIFRYFP